MRRNDALALPPVPDKKIGYAKMVTVWVSKLSPTECTQLMAEPLPSLPDNASPAHRAIHDILSKIRAQNSTHSDNSIEDIIQSELTKKIEAHKQIVASIPNVILPDLPPSLLLIVPGDIFQLLFMYYLNGTDSFNFLRASPRFFVPFKKTISQNADHPLRKLLSHGALGELEQAEAYYINDNFILTCYGTVYHANRFYDDTTSPPTWTVIPEEMSFPRPKYKNVTYLQMLMVNEEWQEATKVAKRIPMNEVVKQFFEVFPHGKIIKYDHDGKEWDFNKALKYLKALFHVVSKSKVTNINDLTKTNEWKEFFEYNKTNPAGHSQGLVLDPRIVEAILKMYEDRYNEFDNDAQRFLWNLIEERLKSMLGTGLLRKLSQGIIIKGEAHRKGCVLADGSSYFAFRRSAGPLLLPGFHFWVTWWGYQAQGRGGLSNGSVWPRDEPFQNLCQATRDQGTKFMQKYASTPKVSGCLTKLKQ